MSLPAVSPLAPAFRALTGYDPYVWQRRLYDEYLARGETPDGVDVPTGLGKTMVMALWAIALGAGAKLPRRVVYVVDRRTVVDQATAEAEAIAGRLADKAQDPAIAPLRERLGLAPGESLPISTLRGQHADNRAWLSQPHKATIVVGTVDMIGSRLLFQGYGVSRRMRPMHAGLLGADAWILFDEAHLAPPFAEMLREVAGHKPATFVPPFRTTSLSATGRNSKVRCVFALEDADVADDAQARKRLTASKRLTLEQVGKSGLAKTMAERAVALANEGGRRVLVYANSRKAAQEIAALIGKAAPEAPRELVVGARRFHERERLKDSAAFKRFDPGDTENGPAFLVATSAGEVGVDLDADALVMDLAPWERMVQRLGRVNRRAEPGVAPVVVFDAIEDDADDEPSRDDRKGATAARERITAALREAFASAAWPLGEDGAREASPLALRRLDEDAILGALLARACTPAPLRPALSGALVDAWALTTLESHTGRPIVDPWLRGWIDKEPQTQALWRATLPPIVPDDSKATLERLGRFFAAAPPHTTEILETYAYEVASLAGRRGEATPFATPETPEGFALDAIAAVLLDSAGEVRRYWTLDGLRRKPPGVGDLANGTLVLNAKLGGLNGDGLLDDKASAAPATIESRDWSAAPERVGFRVEVVKPGAEGNSSAEKKKGVVFRCPQRGDNEDGDGPQIRVQAARGRADAAGDLAVASKPQTLDAHAAAIGAEAAKIADALALPPDARAALLLAARLHDAGKDRKLWQRAMNAPDDGPVYAKTEGGGNPQRLRVGEETYRHEFGSLRDAALDPELARLAPETRDLVLHLIAAHHGCARPTIAAIDFDEPSALMEARAQEAALRFARLHRRWGAWGLAWLESLLRAADWAASAANDEPEPGP